MQGNPIPTPDQIGAQPFDADLTAYAALSTTGLVERTGAGTVGTVTATAFAKTLLDDANAATARTTLGAAAASHTQAWSTITSTPTTLSGYGIADAQPLDADLTALAGLATTGVIERTGAGTATTFTVTSFAKNLLDDVDAATARTTLDAAAANHTQTWSTITSRPTTLSGYGITDAQPLDADLTAIAELATTGVIERTGLGTATTFTVTTSAKQLLDDSSFAAMRTTLELGSISTQSASNVAITGGTIAGITDLAIADGGTGSSTAQGAINALAGAVTSGQYLRGNGTNVVMSAIQASDVPTLNQNTTGTASNVTGIVAVANGGTGADTVPQARTNLGATTVGSSLFTLPDPSAITFPRFNADNSVSALNAADFRTAISAQPLDTDLTALAGLSTTGLIERTGSGTAATLAIENNTWTPTIIGMTTAGTATYTEQVGYYTRLGSLWFLHCRISWSGHTGTGQMRISGLPATISSVTGRRGAAAIYQATYTLPANCYPIASGVQSTSQILLAHATISTGTVSATSLAETGTIQLGIFYWS